MPLIEFDKNPSRRTLLIFGALLAGFVVVAGAVARWRFDAPTAARWIWIVGGGIAAVHLALPPIRRFVYLGWMYAALPIGWTVSNVLLLVIYYGVMTPIGLVLRLTGRDPLRLRFDRDASTYWTEHDPAGDPRRYFRQF